MATNLFIAGPYTATHTVPSGTALDMGMTEDGINIRFRVEKQVIGQSAIYGDSILDAVYRGGNCSLSYLSMEFNKSLLNGAAWYQNTVGVANQGKMATIGTLDVGSTKALSTVLTAVAGTTAAASPATFTALQTALIEGHELNWTMTSRLKTQPIMMRMYPYTVSASEVWYTVT